MTEENELSPEIQEYSNKHHIEEVLTLSVNEVLRNLPPDPFSALLSIIKEHTDSRSANQTIADNTQKIGNLTENQKSEQRGKKNLGIIKYRDFLCRSLSIGFCNTELSTCCGCSCQKQN